MTNDKDSHTERYLTTDLTDETDFFNYELYEPLARRSQLHECEFFAFLAKAPSGWFPKSLV